MEVIEEIATQAAAATQEQAAPKPAHQLRKSAS